MRAFSVSDESLAAVVSPLVEIDVSTWQWVEPDDQIFMSGELLVEVAPTGYAPGWFVHAVTTRPDAVTELKAIAEIGWRE